MATISLPTAGATSAIPDGPQMLLNADGVFVDGTKLAEPPSEGTITPAIIVIFETLRTKRDAWRSQNPGASFPGTIGIWVDARTPEHFVKRLIETVAYAGYPEATLAVRDAKTGKIAGVVRRTEIKSPNGRLPPEIIQNVIRTNFGRFRLCYEAGLARNSALHGDVGVRFTITEDGRTTNVATTDQTNLPDQEVVRCLVQRFGELEYPKPEGGIITVTYPIRFLPN